MKETRRQGLPTDGQQEQWAWLAGGRGGQGWDASLEIVGVVKASVDGRQAELLLCIIDVCSRKWSGEESGGRGRPMRRMSNAKQKEMNGKLRQVRKDCEQTEEVDAKRPSCQPAAAAN